MICRWIGHPGVKFVAAGVVQILSDEERLGALIAGPKAVSQ